MKRLFATISILYCSHTSFAQQNYLSKKDIREFSKHFRILDSIAVESPSDTILNGRVSIYFMETKTKIDATPEGNYLGRFMCTKEDLLKWHNWFNKNIDTKK